MAKDILRKAVLTPEQMTTFMSELRTGERVVSIKCDDESERVVILKKVTKRMEVQGRAFYAAYFNMLLKNGVPTRAESRKTYLEAIKNSGVNIENFEERKEAIQKKLAERVQESVDEVQAVDMLKSLPKLLQVMNQQLENLTPDEQTLLNIIADNEALEMQIMGNSAESITETETTLFLLSQVAYNPDGTKVWPDSEALNNETDKTFMIRLQEEFMRFRSGLPLLFEVNIPNPSDLPNESPSS